MELSLECFERVLQLNHKHINARLAKASALNKLGYLNQSVSEYELALNLETSTDSIQNLNDTNYFD